ncbi:MAG: hypothetical protein KAU91_04515 [Candidatus Aminicenantes bacterium]|nr:hypothetical protein [Candidatus Aminicenantes bacterium]
MYQLWRKASISLTKKKTKKKMSAASRYRLNFWLGKSASLIDFIFKTRVTERKTIGRFSLKRKVPAYFPLDIRDFNTTIRTRK